MCSDYSYVESHKAMRLKKSHSLIKPLNDLSVEVYEHGRILPMRPFARGNETLARGGVVDQTGRYSELSRIPGWAVGAYEPERIRFNPKIAVYCGCLIFQWGHFLLESITRLWYFLEHDCSEFVYVFVVNEAQSTQISGNYLEFIELLGISDRIEIINTTTEYETVIVPARSFQYKMFYSHQYKRLLDYVAERAAARISAIHTTDRLFLSRSHFPKAQKTEVGLEMLDDYFERNNYQLLFPETMSLSELIVRLRNANECASESGTAAHNFLFCKDCQNVLIVERQTVVNDAQTSINVLRDLNAVYVDGHLTIYPVMPGEGPFFLYYTEHFALFSASRGYSSPDSWLLQDKYIAQCLRLYMDAYRALSVKASIREPLLTSYDRDLHDAYKKAHAELDRVIAGGDFSIMVDNNGQGHS